MSANVRAFNNCPWTGNSWFTDRYENSGDESTSSFTFNGGWKPSTNTYGGTYNYITRTQSGQTTGYDLEVVPNWNKLTWVGTAPFCNNNLPEACRSADFNSYPFKPRQWAGYSSNNNAAINRNMITTTPTGCNTCSSGNMVLCTYAEQMTNDSCPGFGQFRVSPSVVPLLTDNPNNEYYTGIDSNLYPRGKGKCFYPIDMIQSDDELTKLLDLKKNSKIHPEMADKLAAEYCYRTVQGATCGKDNDGNDITNCVKYKVDSLDSNSARKPCTIWRSEKSASGNTVGRRMLDDYGEQWCNRNANKYTPLCDCIKRDDRTGGVNIPVRNFYDTITNKYRTLTSTIPPHCWYQPCETGSYAIPQLTTEGNCPVSSNVCPQIITGKEGSELDTIKQYSSCTINAADGTKVVDPNAPADESTTATTPSSSIFTKPYVYIPIIFTVVAITIAMIFSSSAVAVGTVATAAAVTTAPAVAAQAAMPAVTGII